MELTASCRTGFSRSRRAARPSAPVTQVAIAERLEDRLRRLALMGADPEALEAEKTIAAMHRETAKAVIAGLTVLRATPRSRMAARESRSRFERGAGALRPWNIVAKKSEGQAS